MAFIQCDFFSTVLQLSVSMNVVLPQPIRESYPVLYLLHGLWDDHTSWTRYTLIERYAETYGLAVVMPEAGRSYYTDMVSGYRYGEYMGEEVPEVAEEFFPLSTKREERFVAGHSMGGYGAFKLALERPERFAAAASLSGPLNHAQEAYEGMAADWLAEQRLIFGDRAAMAGSVHDLRYLAEQMVAAGGEQVRLYQCCGTEDKTYRQNQRFLAFARGIKLELTYEEGPGGHEWGYWDRMIQRVLEWLPLTEKGTQGNLPSQGRGQELVGTQEGLKVAGKKSSSWIGRNMGSLGIHGVDK
jgi:putative tributyrin esterase